MQGDRILKTDRVYIKEHPLNCKALIIFLLLIFLVGGAPYVIADEAERMEQLEREIRDLKLKVDQFPKAPPKPRSNQFKLPKLRVYGFGHFQYEVRNDENEFTLGEFDLFLTSDIADNLSLLSETVVIFGDHGTNTLDVERLLLKYEAANYLNIVFGRGHTAVGYWNYTYHHGVWFQLTISRPEILKFDHHEGILPTHFVGMELNGNINGDWGLLSYVFQTANGRGRTTHDVQTFNDVDDNKMVNFYLDYKPSWAAGLGIGGNYMIDKIPANPNVGRTSGTQEIIMGAHLNYMDSRMEFLSEYIVIQHNGISDQTHSGGYAQIGYSFDKWVPYYRFEFMNIDPSSSYFQGILDLDQHTLGVRYDWFTYASIKIEYRNMESPRKSRHSGWAQVSFAF